MRKKHFFDIAIFELIIFFKSIFIGYNYLISHDFFY